MNGVKNSTYNKERDVSIQDTHRIADGIFGTGRKPINKHRLMGVRPKRPHILYLLVA